MSPLLTEFDTAPRVFQRFLQAIPLIQQTAQEDVGFAG